MYTKSTKSCSLAIGKHRRVSDKKFKRKQLTIGMKVEKEHTNRRGLAKQIAKDHLSEIPDYYTRLTKMERKARRKK